MASARRLKSLVQSTVRRFGYEIRQVDAEDPFVVQRDLVSREDPLILDVGAYKGDIAGRYRAIFPEALIYCFEPHPTSFSSLVESTESDERIRCFNIGLAEKSGTLTLYENASAATNSLLETHQFGRQHWGGGLLDPAGEIEIPTVTLDEFLADEAILKVDILKLDVQGGELRVLQGARKCLGAVDVVFMEVLLAPTYEDQPAFSEYVGFLRELGFTIIDFFNHVRRNGRLLQLDLLAVRDGFRPGE